MAIVLFVLAITVIPIWILLRSQHGTKQGCGRGCATCGNRDICYRRSKRPSKGPQR
ncbi:MAG: hypothetical protein HFF50_01660 [Lawsonibacter sp.]|nr:hypothetical protein [Lawsonibacter sp.]